MDVILLRDLRQTGSRGEVVSVKPGFARNYLIPKGIAAHATHANLKWFESQRTKIDARHAAERNAAVELSASILGASVEIRKRASESATLYGSVTPAEVVEALHAQGIEVDRRMVDMSGGIKTVGEHTVRIELHPEVIAEVTVKVVADDLS